MVMGKDLMIWGCADMQMCKYADYNFSEERQASPHPRILVICTFAYLHIRTLDTNVFDLELEHAGRGGHFGHIAHLLAQQPFADR
jgi:hypothetical protein